MGTGTGAEVGIAPTGYTGIYSPTGRPVFSGAAGGVVRGGGVVLMGIAVGVLGVVVF